MTKEFLIQIVEVITFHYNHPHLLVVVTCIEPGEQKNPNREKGIVSVVYQISFYGVRQFAFIEHRKCEEVGILIETIDVELEQDERGMHIGFYSGSHELDVYYDTCEYRMISSE